MEDKCIFCDIASGKSPADIILDEENVSAFYDISPKTPIHILIVPKKHIPSVAELTVQDKNIIGEMVLAAKKIAEQKNLSEDGYRLVINTGKNSGQEVDHIHLHLLGGEELGPMA